MTVNENALKACPKCGAPCEEYRDRTKPGTQHRFTRPAPDVEGLKEIIEHLAQDVLEAQLQGHFRHKARGWLSGFKTRVWEARAHLNR